MTPKTLFPERGQRSPPVDPCQIRSAAPVVFGHRHGPIGNIEDELGTPVAGETNVEEDMEGGPPSFHSLLKEISHFELLWRGLIQVVFVFGVGDAGPALLGFLDVSCGNDASYLFGMWLCSFEIRELKAPSPPGALQL